MIGSNHTTNEENYLLQKFTRQILKTSNIDHHRTGDLLGLLAALRGRKNTLATTADLSTTKAALIVDADLSQEHPLLAYLLRTNWPLEQSQGLGRHAGAGSRRQLRHRPSAPRLAKSSKRSIN